MSFATLHQAATEDAPLANRIGACVQKESRYRIAADGGGIVFATRVVNGEPLAGYFYWPVAIATEDQYEYAINSGVPDPGADPTVIPDAAILSAVQAAWPES